MPAKVTRITDPDMLPDAPSGSGLIVRYGGFGDMIVAAAVIAGLKNERGLRVVVNTQEQGYDILRSDPYVDELWVQNRGLVPPDERIDRYWGRLNEGFDYYVNLSESVEVSLLAYPGRVQYRWPRRLRNQVMDVNYLERTLDIAGLSHVWIDHARFHPTEGEKKWAMKERRKVGLGIPVVVFSLSGSSLHKAYPHADVVMGNLMAANPRLKIVTVGDYSCKILEYGLNKFPRIIRRSGRWSIRQTLAFAQVADVVLGTETGVLNAVGMESVPKVVMLSHSTEENLTKHWQNTQALKPDFRAWCYPCHKMHLTADTCPRDETTRASICTQYLNPRVVSDAVLDALREKRIELSAAV